MRANELIGTAIGWDAKEVSDNRYQRYVNPIVYSIGSRYFAASETKPKHQDVGGEWQPYSWQKDGEKKKVWYCDAITSKQAA